MRIQAPTLTAILTTMLVACAPPPKATGLTNEPSIDLLLPEDGSNYTLECAPNPLWDCDDNAQNTGLDPYVDAVVLTIVASIDNLELTDPYDDRIELVEGQGHYHVNINGSQVTSAFEQVWELVTPAPDGITTGVTLFSVDLRDNLHGELGPLDQIEMTFNANPEDCALLAEDFCP